MYLTCYSKESQKKCMSLLSICCMVHMPGKIFSPQKYCPYAVHMHKFQMTQLSSQIVEFKLSGTFSLLLVLLDHNIISKEFNHLNCALNTSEVIIL